mmetsp:Transcript_15584/g.45007  ORF Transcript_15584/g.45007 Transcript_15584/m.45007 type:complete len:489 (-) Transcript_15584:12-1478(-)
MTNNSKSLVLPQPQGHALSLKLAAGVVSGSNSTASLSGVVKTRVVSPGLVELTLQAGDPSSYGSRTWPLRIGGAGIGDDEDNSALAMLGCLVIRAPIAVRFAVPIALHGVDDAGFCDASFWSERMREEPTLENIALKAIQWLEGSHEQGASEEWKNTERHAKKGLDVIQNYVAIRKNEFSSSGSSSIPLVTLQNISLEWIVPALRPLFMRTSAESIQERARALLDLKQLVTEIGPGIYTFDLFTPLFCDLLIAEVDAFEATKLPCRRPNTMNKLGLVVNDIGLEPILTDILESLMDPICQILYGEDAPIITSALDHHHSFIVRYRNESNNTTKKHSVVAATDDDGSRGLDMHHDASEATLNVCLGRDGFTSGGLRFCGRYGDANHRSTGALISHSKGRAILHLGRHRHGADDIESGERINLIMWARNSAYRGAAAFGHVPLDGTPQRKETGVVDMLCLSKSNDRDYEEKMKLLDPTSQRATKKNKYIF